MHESIDQWLALMTKLGTGHPRADPKSFSGFLAVCSLGMFVFDVLRSLGIPHTFIVCESFTHQRVMSAFHMPSDFFVG